VREARADHFAEEMIFITEEIRAHRMDPKAGSVALSGLQWLAQRYNPKRYGDKTQLEEPKGTGVRRPVIEVPITPTSLREWEDAAKKQQAQN
jgi:hypothetical protein